MPTISAFTIVKDAIRQGYPFAETIASVLPVCDELLISDGYSTDATYETLQRISSLNKKIKIFRNRWTRKEVTVLADVSNDLRKKCSSDYLFYVQAAEVVHEDSANMLRALPELFPKTDTFCLPFTTAISNFKTQEDFRLRFCRNLERYALAGDAWAISVTKKFVRNEATRNLKHPRKLLNFVGRGIEWAYAGSLNNIKSKALYLPKPLVRYPALFKANFIERCKGHADFFSLPNFREIVKQLETEKDEAFFEKAANILRGNFNTLDINYQGQQGTLNLNDHPRIMHEFIKKGTQTPRYYVRGSILDQIANTSTLNS